MEDTAHTQDDAPKRAASADIKSVALTFRVLFELARSKEALGVSELARRLGEARAAVHKHLITLRGLGIVMQSAPTDRYRLGWKLVELGLAAEAQVGIIAIADPYLKRLRDETGLTAFLEQANGERMVVSHSIPSENMIAVTVRKGLEAPVHGSAGGRVMLAFSPNDVQDRMLSGSLQPMSERMMTDAAEVRRRLALIRQRMYDTTAGESPSGIHSLAAPVLGEGGVFVAAVGVIGTQAQIRVPPDGRQVELVQQCAATVSKAIQSDAYDSLGISTWL
jgi:IclR family transcriptional regulator, KDG regulon repressor